MPGLFDADTGVIRLFPNLPGPWPGFPLRDRLEAGFGRPVAIINDARAHTLAESRMGAGRGASTMALVTLGTGIGGGLIIDGKLHLGTGTAGEIGHQTVLLDGPLCGCGNRGCAEALAQARALTDAGGRATVEEVFAGAVDGDERCVAAVGQAARYLGVAVANVVNVLAPDRVVVGGGIAGAGEGILEPLRAIRPRACRGCCRRTGPRSCWRSWARWPAASGPRWPGRRPRRPPSRPLGLGARGGLARAELVEHLGGLRRPAAVRADIHDLDQRVERPDPAGRLDLDVRARRWRASGSGPRASRRSARTRSTS